MRYQIQFAVGNNWEASASNPVEGAFQNRAEASLMIATRLAKPDCAFDFRIREVPDLPFVAKIDSRISESEQAVDRAGL